MTNFPLIARYLPELEIKTVRVQTEIASGLQEVIYPRDLEAALQKGGVVYGNPDESDSLEPMKYDTDTHSGLLLGYSEIEKPKAVSKEYLLSELDSVQKYMQDDSPEAAQHNLIEIIQRIKAHGVTNE